MASIIESQQRMNKYSVRLPASDKRFLKNTEVVHRDGTMLRIHCGFTMEDPEDPQWVWLITEHFGDLVFDKEDITSIVLSTSKILAKPISAGTILLMLFTMGFVFGLLLERFLSR